MTKPFILGDIHSISVDFNIDFPKQLDDFEVKPRFQKCQEAIEVRIKSITRQEDSTFIFEFATQEDSDLFLSNYRVNSIRMIFVE